MCFPFSNLLTLLGQLRNKIQELLVNERVGYISFYWQFQGSECYDDILYKIKYCLQVDSEFPVAVRENNCSEVTASSEKVVIATLLPNTSYYVTVWAHSAIFPDIISNLTELTVTTLGKAFMHTCISEI